MSSHLTLYIFYYIKLKSTFSNKKGEEQQQQTLINVQKDKENELGIEPGRLCGRWSSFFPLCHQETPLTERAQLCETSAHDTAVNASGK